MFAQAAGAVLTNSSFETDAVDSQTITGWTESGPNPSASFISNGVTPKNGTRYLGHYAAGSFNVVTSQTKTGLPNGIYTLKAWVQRNNISATTVQMEASGFGGSTLTAAIPVTSVWTQISIPGINITNGTCVVGFRTVASGGAAVRIDLVELEGNLVINPSFEIDPLQAQTITGWAESGPNPSASFISNTATPKSGTRYLGHYSASSFNVFTSQTRTVANGVYTLKAWVQRTGTFSTVQMEASGFGGTIRTAPIPAASVWTQITIPGIKVTTGSLTFGFRTVAAGGAAVRIDLVELAPGRSPYPFFKRPLSGIGLNCADGADFPHVNYKMPGGALLDWANKLGVNVLRVTFKWEALQSNLGQLNGPLNSTRLAAMKAFMGMAETKNINIVWDLHNYAYFTDQSTGIKHQVGSAAVPNSAFADFWRRFATEFKDYEHVAMYGLMNEPNLSCPNWKASAQAAVDAIRTVDPRTPIAVPGRGASSWDWCGLPNQGVPPRNADMLDVTGDYVLFEGHQYPDSDGSGKFEVPYDTWMDTVETWGYPDINDFHLGSVKMLPPSSNPKFFDWLATNDLRGFIGETGMPSGMMYRTDLNPDAWAAHPDYHPGWVEAIRRTCVHGINNGIPIFIWSSGEHIEQNKLSVTHKAPWANNQPADPVQVMIKTALAGKPLIQ